MNEELGENKKVKQRNLYFTLGAESKIRKSIFYFGSVCES